MNNFNSKPPYRGESQQRPAGQTARSTAAPYNKGSQQPMQRPAQQAYNGPKKAPNPNKIGALWAKKDKNGNPMFTGTVNNEKIVIFTNNYKKEDNHPDFIVMKSVEREKTGEEPDYNENVPF